MARVKRARNAERFAAIPREVMESDAWRTLPHGARTTLLILAAQYAGVANGVQCLSRKICETFGIEHSNAHRSAKLLKERGLIVETYTAKYTASRARIPTMYALAWRDVSHRGNDVLARAERAPDGWRIWRPPTQSVFQSGRNDRSRRVNAVESAARESQNCGRNPSEARKTAVESTNPLRLSGEGAAREDENAVTA